MDKKEIKETRMRSIFIESAKKLIKGEGIQVVSVRNIAEDTGYSYATIYKYFKNLNDLIYECVKDFSVECIEFNCMAAGRSKNIKGDLANRSISYINYFVQYPGIFDVFFLDKMQGFSMAERFGKLSENLYNAIFMKFWDELTDDINEQKKFIFMHKNSMYGLMLMYINRRIPPDYKDFMETVKLTLDSIISTY